MIDYRQQIVTVIAVFLSLGLGIFIGNALLGDDLVLNQQQQVIERLERHYQALLDDNQRLQERLARLEIWQEADRAFEKALVPALLTGKLTGHRVALLSTTGGEMETEISGLLRECGAEILSVVSLRGEFSPQNNELALFLEQELIGGSHAGWSEFVEYLAGAVTGSRSGHLLQSLAGMGWLSAQGDPRGRIDTVVLLGGGPPGQRTGNSDLEKLLIMAWQKEGTRVVVAGTSWMEATEADMFRDMEIPMAKTVDTLAGRLALVKLLGGGEGEFTPVGGEIDESSIVEWLQGMVEKPMINK